jgi:hypothetical protein
VIEQFYYVVTVPQPHSEFDSYMVKAAPEVGVCTVVGIGRDHENDRYGTSVRRSFSGLNSTLENNYGVNLNFDFIKNGALWDDPDEWVMSIRQNERDYVTFWNDDEGSDMPEGIQSISLTVNALSSYTAYVSLSYEFDNLEECMRIAESQDESGL